MDSNSQPLVLAFNRSPIGNYVKHVLLWEDPVETGLLFLISNVFLLFLITGEYTLITLVSYLVLVSVLNALLYVQMTRFQLQFRNKPFKHPLSTRFGTEYKIPRTFFEDNIDLFTETAVFVVSNIVNAVLVRNRLHSLKVILIFTTLAVLGNYFQTLTLLWLSLFFDFLWIKIYSKKQEKIHQLLNKFVLAPLQKKFPAYFSEFTPSSSAPSKKTQ